MSDTPSIPDEPETPDLIVTYGDCEFYGRCACGVALGQPIRPDQSLDVLGQRWERHVMRKECAR